MFLVACMIHTCVTLSCFCELSFKEAINQYRMQSELDIYDKNKQKMCKEKNSIVVCKIISNWLPGMMLYI